ncbi:hypothetical protein OG302_42825 [Streptomyces sp. NBC_01283]|uniref:glycosyltransferase family 2 protein n=1 Tax=Streptomyces sp. NBC_01283 TaxID=2903812 RepID=UPI00352F07AC|nr:hypothetical protein OG302_42825 [Streptomyces sp. NBC_01283]
MAPPNKNRVEVVIINWKRPSNVVEIVSALRRQTVPCTVTICDCHNSPEFQLPFSTLSSSDRVYRWEHNLGSFSRYIPVGGYDHEYTFFIDDDMLPGMRCVEHFLTWAERLSGFGALGQLGRILESDGSYRPQDIARRDDFTEVDILVRAFFVRTESLVHVPQMRNLLREFEDPEDDILLAVGLGMYAGLASYLTPSDADPETLVNMNELDRPYSRQARPHHLQARSLLLRRAMRLGWQPVRRRRNIQPATNQPHGSAEKNSGVLYVATRHEERGPTIASISSLRNYGYLGPIRVVTDDADWLPSSLECESAVVPEVGGGYPPQYHKTRLLEFSFETTLYLGSDAIPAGSIDDMWRYVDDCDIAITIDSFTNVGGLIDQPQHHWSAEECELMIRLGLTGRTLFDSRIILLKKSAATTKLFALWHQEWQRFGKLDQLALVRAAAFTGASVRTVPVTRSQSSRRSDSSGEAQASAVRALRFQFPEQTLIVDEFASTRSNGDRNQHINS